VAAGGIRRAVSEASESAHHLMKIGVEARTLADVKEAIEAGADAVLLDNMSDEDMRRAVAWVDGRRTVLEASGNMTLSRVRAVAETGVHVISVGALTHSAPAVDLSLTICNV
jgi:nicotinate-nucleotide pyrophosphorylase (carboxylating)